MYRLLRFLAVNAGYALMGVSVIVTAAQPATCAPLVAQALSAVDQNCTGLGRNTVCYGYNRVDATFAAEVADDFFSTPADRAPLAELASIQTAPLDIETEQWGVAMMNVQANVPNTLPGQAVTFVLLGDARVENAVPSENAFIAGEPVRVVITTGQRINVRSGPGTNFNVVANAEPGQLFDVDARNDVGDWFRLAGPAPHQWISRSLFAVQSGGAGQLTDLPVAPESPQSPMQAFYFRTGIGAPQCVEAPDLLVVQGPKSVRVTLNVNGAEVALGSTVAFQSGEATLGQLKSDQRLGGLLQDLDAPDNVACLTTEMTVLEGDALANGGELFVPLGHWARSATCLDENRTPSFTTAFSEPVEMTDEELAGFEPLTSLPLPHYQLELPTREQIEQSKNSGPDEKPTPTRLPQVQIARPTPRATQQGSGDAPPGITETPSGPAVDPDAPSCEGFGIIGPGGSANAFGQLFAWSFARNVAGYQLEINGYVEDQHVGTQLYRVGGEMNGINVELYTDFGGPSHIQWKVQVLVRDGSGNLLTLCESGYQNSDVFFGE